LCGPSGLETDRYLLNNSGIDRASIFCSNVVRDYRDDAPPSPEEILRDTPELNRELHAAGPHYVCAMGLYAARWFLGDDIEMEWANGLAFPHFHTWADGTGAEMVVMPVYHAAAGLHQPAIAAKVAWGMEQFGKMCRGEKMPTGHLRDNARMEYAESKRRDLVIDYRVAVDTEGSVEHPWCLSWSNSDGHGQVVRNRPIQFKGLTVLHNALHDLPVLAAMGVTPAKWTDTMLMAALLGVEPQSLKALARRHAGMRMREYNDVIAGARREKALEYLSRAVDWAVEHSVSAAKV
jgi:uracil-DNA glycosylase family 4